MAWNNCMLWLWNNWAVKIIVVGNNGSNEISHYNFVPQFVHTLLGFQKFFCVIVVWNNGYLAFHLKVKLWCENSYCSIYIMFNFFSLKNKRLPCFADLCQFLLVFVNLITSGTVFIVGYFQLVFNIVYACYDLKYGNSK